MSKTLGRIVLGIATIVIAAVAVALASAIYLAKRI